METETLRIFNEHHHPIGTASRDEVHRKGYWHETFHCWVLEGNMIYFQIRSMDKKDYPGLLDITVAGHLLAEESVEDGVREIQEEIGLNVMIEDLNPLGVVKNSIVIEKMKDHEFSHVFVYQGIDVEESFSVLEDEVSGIVKAEFKAFEQLVFKTTDKIYVEGFGVDKSGNRKPIRKMVNIDDFVPHERDYLINVVILIDQKILRLQRNIQPAVE